MISPKSRFFGGSEFWLDEGFGLFWKERQTLALSNIFQEDANYVMDNQFSAHIGKGGFYWVFLSEIFI